MVVAEVPLWVLHSTASPGGADHGPTKTDASASSASFPDAHYLSRANESISLLTSVGGGKKCAIYSVDMHPDGTKFATGGGDGTVRLWNSSALFSKHAKGGTYDGGENKGMYASSSGDSSDENSKASSSAAAAAAAGPTDPASSSDEHQQENVVHDLNQLVRRKKDGSTPVKKPAAASPNQSAPSGVPLAPSPGNRQGTEMHHRLLCTMSAHTGSSVLAVRFSTSGQYLASAGDDAAVCIYVQNASSAAAGNLDTSHVEQWSRIKLCRGHTLDVVGLAWAPDDSHLVSCSLDSDAPIIVWKLTDLADTSSGQDYHPSAHRTPSQILCHPYKILGKGIHTSTVKGVTFDPAGTYLASSGDDPAVCIWRAHDDWGLEKRIEDGIFRKWKEDERELSSQTLFRRLSWSTDGSYICSTNGTVKNKHVASTISREGWSVSSSQSAAAGAANLVGHKQPVVVSRHCPQLLDVTRKGSDDERDHDDDEGPEYATLVALGDKKGFISVWSTRKSRPIFKLQCSESRCTVTDLAWGRTPGGDDMILLVSLLDGQVVALKFGVPSELGPILSSQDQKRVFQLRYGIDLDDDSGFGRRRMFVGDNSAPKLIENALQFTLEQKTADDDDAFGGGGDASSTDDDDKPISSLASPNQVKKKQSETQVKGKKRIRPVLMGADGASSEKRSKNGDSRPENGNKGKKEKKKTDPVLDALESAERAASAAEDISAVAAKRDASSKGRQEPVGDKSTDADHTTSLQHHRLAAPSSVGSQPQLSYSTSRIHSVDLPVPPDPLLSSDENSVKMVADCTNVMHVPSGSAGQALPCTVLSISRSGKAKWKDEITGTYCSAIAASKSMLAVGSADGTVYLYGTAPTLGWASGAAFRSHPPLVFGHAIVALQLMEESDDTDVSNSRLRMLVVTADGSFGVYTLMPECKLCYKGSILPAMTHMSLSTSSSGQPQSKDLPLPKLARIQITESDHLFLVLSLEPKSSRSASDESVRNRAASHPTPSFGVGGAVQAFVYHLDMELWLRVSDSRFLLSDFYSTLPKKSSSNKTVLEQMDNAVRSGAATSSLKPSRRGASASVYHHAQEEDGSNIVTRSHCEDRLACALALKSTSEFRSWLTLYVRTLAMGGHVDHLRLVVDLLSSLPSEGASICCWWLSSAPTVLDLDRKDLIKSIVIPEMSKNRALQRLTNEVSMAIES